MMQLPDEAKPLYRRDSKRLSRQTISRVYDEVTNFTLPAKLFQQSPRLLALAGEKEMGLILDSLPDFHQLKTAVTANIPNAHHGWNGEFPQLFTETVASWVEERPLPAALQITNPQTAARVATS
jgi:hypothetical protein